MFLETYELFYEFFFKQILGAEYVWIRIEFQHRGSPHFHGFCKTKEPSPGISFMTNILKSVQRNIDINEEVKIETDKELDSA